jgi:hypothetical protein
MLIQVYEIICGRNACAKNVPTIGKKQITEYLTSWNASLETNGKISKELTTSLTDKNIFLSNV